jgi:simple sugar transport system ATP-binding protein
MTSGLQSETEPLLLKAIGLRKDYGHVRALDSVDFDLRHHEIHAVIGDNGAGKSTLIKIIAGAVQPDRGTLEIDGREVTFSSPHDARAAGIETVYQDLALADPLDAAENVFLGRELCYGGLLGRLGFVDRRAMHATTAANLRDLGVNIPSLTVPVETFSGGQRQAVAVVRATVWGQRFLIMDEPVAALGVQQTTHVLDLMQRARDEKGLSVILISHNMPEVLRVADRVTVLRLGSRVGTIAAKDATPTLLVGAMTGALNMLGEAATS